jgi:hypothetical protein
MENFISKAVRWMVFIPAVAVALHFAQKLFITCLEQAFMYSSSIGIFLLLLLPGIFVWFIIGFFVYSIFKTLTGICPSAKGAKITLIVFSLLALSQTYFKIIETDNYSFFQEFGIFIWIYSLYGFTILGAKERFEKERKYFKSNDSVETIDFYNEIPVSA